MSFAAIRSAIEARLASQWVMSGQARTLVGYDGHAFTPAANSVRLTILEGEGRNASIGAPGTNLVRHAGVIAIQVFTNGGQGSAASRAHEDAIAEIFRNATFGNIRCGVPYVSGALEEKPFLIRTVMIPFTSDDFVG